MVQGSCMVKATVVATHVGGTALRPVPVTVAERWNGYGTHKIVHTTDKVRTAVHNTQ